MALVAVDTVRTPFGEGASAESTHTFTDPHGQLATGFYLILVAIDSSVETVSSVVYGNTDNGSGAGQAIFKYQRKSAGFPTVEVWYHEQTGSGGDGLLVVGLTGSRAITVTVVKLNGVASNRFGISQAKFDASEAHPDVTISGNTDGLSLVIGIVSVNGNSILIVDFGGGDVINAEQISGCSQAVSTRSGGGTNRFDWKNGSQGQQRDCTMQAFEVLSSAVIITASVTLTGSGDVDPTETVEAPSAATLTGKGFMHATGQSTPVIVITGNVTLAGEGLAKVSASSTAPPADITGTITLAGKGLAKVISSHLIPYFDESRSEPSASANVDSAPTGP